ncbi:hypothetical protein [Arthrobacter sp. NPDC056493]|uniref:hypothetical protein n=1 Tax=Arthrobacter sp. NPDC056493 TaxID=3345839 RepID=UPI00366B8781
MVVHYRVLLVLGYEWETSIEDAAEAVKADMTPIFLDSNDGKDAFLHFLLYPASAHGALSRGDEIADALAAINPLSTSRVVLVACAPTYPNLEQSAVDEFVGQKLTSFVKKNGIRALEPESLKEQAEGLMRFSLRQLGISPVSADNGPSADQSQNGLARYGASTWRF